MGFISSRGEYFMKSLRLFPIALLACLLTTSAHAQLSWKPQKNVEIVVPAGPGGGQDQIGRTIQRIMQEQNPLVSSMSVVNRPGGGGTVSWTYVLQKTTDPHYLSIFAPPLLTNHIHGRSSLHHSQLTPIALFASEYIAFAVRADSPFTSAKDLFERLKKDPASISISTGSAIGSITHIALGKVLKAAGVDVKRLRVVAFDSSPAATTALLGGHIDLVSTTPVNFLAHKNEGRLRLLGVSAPKRLGGGLSDVPTWKEMGVNVVDANWRGLIGAGGLTQQQVEFWGKAMLDLSNSPEWKNSVLEKNSWEGSYMSPRDTSRFLNEEYAEMKAALVDLGLVK
jgi:putative tricarboxylic transport membrane protein